MSLTITVTDGRGGRVRDGGLAKWLRDAAPARARGEVAIALVGDTAMRRLNHTFRGRNYPTDVLSFPSENRPLGSFYGFRKMTPGVGFLGDIVIARGVARRQARAQGHGLATELRILALHGLLHLLGYDHERDEGEMRRVEERLRRRHGLPAGLIARPAAGSGRR